MVGLLPLPEACTRSRSMLARNSGDENDRSSALSAKTRVANMARSRCMLMMRLIVGDLSSYGFGPSVTGGSGHQDGAMSLQIHLSGLPSRRPASPARVSWPERAGRSRSSTQIKPKPLTAQLSSASTTLYSRCHHPPRALMIIWAITRCPRAVGWWAKPVTPNTYLAPCVHRCDGGAQTV